MDNNSLRPLLTMENIHKAFPGVKALDGVDLEAYPGRVTAVVGENGAGKSTLMKILAGVHQADAGRIHVDGKHVSIDGPAAAQNLGISIIYQERNLVNTLSIAENLYLSDLPIQVRGAGWIDWQKLRDDAQEILNRLGMDLSPTAKVNDLSPAQQQMTEIAKALTSNARIMIMDEPTATLTDRETRKLFEIIDRMREENVAIIFISHRLEEVLAIADYVVVLRDGARVGKLERDELSRELIVNLMVGSHMDDLFSREIESRRESRSTVLEVRGLRNEKLQDVSFDLYQGEILGLGGLVGAGRSEVARALFGIDRAEYSKITVDGHDVTIGKPADAIKHGIGFVTEERHQEGLLSIASVEHNISLAVLDKLIRFLGFINHGAEAALAREFVDKLSIATSSINQKVASLSGGNQQKVILARWLATSPKILVLDEPTKGIDVGAKAEIHRMMANLAQKGLSIIMISSEMPELLGMCDRVLVLRGGRIVAKFDNDDVTQERMLVSAMGQEERLVRT